MEIGLYDLIKVSIEIKWPILLVELIFFLSGIVLIYSGIKTRHVSKTTSIISIVTGVLVILASIYSIIVTMLFGLNW
ncbi:hypothetical protein [Alkalibacterium thalassium]|uniref:Uncharacterized protein n=1 Tax=Alkalibacterium thalassium TaxID=426701 RepID=A0A1G9CPH4_9LACT|nr:hypothetical protein [Alkalibacterium thalassium]SDK53548.1 hypothetical protein SAMN04488098_10373 [Alkalibacterium thalassium]